MKEGRCRHYTGLSGTIAGEKAEERRCRAGVPGVKETRLVLEAV